MVIRTRRRWLTSRRALLPLLAAAVLLARCGQTAPAATASASPATGGEAVAIIERVSQAWSTGEPADVEAAYAPDVVVMAGDGSTLAADREELVATIQGSLGFGNAWRQVGPASGYPASFGRIYALAMFEVTGLAHETGDPIVVICLARDGEVVRQLMIDPKLAL